MGISGPNQSSSKVLPPQRGSFPLDHDGECQSIVKEYLSCLKTARGKNTPCRDLAKAFLQCRMQHGLMSPDEMSSLGFKD
ncbi:hypothetical protein BCR37DRAFT_342782 [Protomyces lactucae-debilis]|uniref:CHCH domain-containing protein n=1 Tax=Protomyces lactucae-debilis TaxID=2754530 RepID=A0A1Y2FYL6_PROLT|nr:uncharacterized protein BCR37DRAFT_342782 [Protomyces lactucae-debilis]ORY87765.1 hypothetical protein BCR37DRAFT_342782 [Protomyces lactucae-debilis]